VTGRPDVDHYLPAVSDGVRTLERSLAELATALAHGDVRMDAEGGGTASAKRRRVADAYTTIDYGADDAVNETHDCLGVVGAPRELARLAEAVNEAKDEIRRVCAPLSRRRVRVPERAGVSSNTRALRLTRAILRTMQRADMNLLAAYRQIPILERPPLMVAYVRAATRAVYRKSRDAVAEMLEHSDHPHAAEDRARLRACRDRWFALLEDYAPNVRANVRFDGLDRRGRRRVQVRAELPLLFAMGRTTAWPEIRFPVGPQATAPRRQREGLLEPAPFLESVRVFRYAKPN
jgi:hypothetical protein